MPVKTFRITNAGPFDDITFEFDERVNVFVGPNNSGKSTVLLALARASVYPFEFPRKLLKRPDNECKWWLTYSDSQTDELVEGYLSEALSGYWGTVDHLREIGYSIFVPSLRRSTEYRAEGPEIHSVEQLLGQNLTENEQNSSQELKKRSSLAATNSALVSDEFVVRKMVNLDYAAYRRRRPQIRQLIHKVVEVASEITEGFHIEFLGIGEDGRGLYPEFRTPDGDLPLNALSQGTQSTVQWLAHFLFGYAQYYDYPEDLEEKPAILIVDEIDAHLHPSWQRRIIPALTNNFPNLQIFCSTHSPLMLAGLGEGQVQLLSRDAEGRVTVSRNRWDMAGWTAEQIMRSVLGVRDTTDLTTTEDIDRMGELAIKDELTEKEKAELEELRQRVGEVIPGGPASSQAESFIRFLREVYLKQESRSGSSDRKRPRVRRRSRGVE